MKLFIIMLLFVTGFVFCCTYTHSDLVEGFRENGECPNLLVQKGSEIHLLKKNKAIIPGVNPIRFNNLEEYVEFLEWQRKMGIECPVLYFQQTYDAQNNLKYRMLPDMVNKNAGMPSHILPQERPLYDAGHDDMPFNKGSYPGFDEQDQNIGVYTPLDKLYHSSSDPSPSAMDSTWGGVQYSRDLVKAGVYKGQSREGAPLDIEKRERHLPYVIRRTLEDTP